MQTIDQICAGFSPERRNQIAEELTRADRSEIPWYLRFIIAIGAWLASLFFIGCGMVFFGFQPEHKLEVGATGLALLLVAVLIHWLKPSHFIEQCALAVSLAGQAMIYYGFVPDSDSGATLTELSVALAIVLYILYPNFLSRLITCVLALQITLWWLHSGEGSWRPWFDDRSTLASTPLALYWVFHLALLVICFLPARLDRFLVPLGYAVALSIVGWQLEDRFPVLNLVAAGTPHFASSLFHFSWSALSTGLVVLGVAFWCAGDLSRAAQRQVLLIALMATVLVLIALGSTGVLLALLLMLLGFSLQKRPLLGLGLLLLPVFLVESITACNVSLLTKSMILAGSGAAVLALRVVLMRFAFTGEVA